MWPEKKKIEDEFQEGRDSEEIRRRKGPGTGRKKISYRFDGPFDRLQQLLPPGYLCPGPFLCRVQPELSQQLGIRQSEIVRQLRELFILLREFKEQLQSDDRDLDGGEQRKRSVC